VFATIVDWSPIADRDFHLELAMTFRVDIPSVSA
jgi:hypothetical protein